MGSLQSSGAANAHTAGSGKPLEYNEDVLNGKLAPPKGFNSNSLFSEKLKNADQRFERLENAVQGINDSLNEYLPAIQKLAAIEGDIQELVAQLQTLVSQPAVSVEPLDAIDVQIDTPAATITPPPAPAQPQTSTPVPKAAVDTTAKQDNAPKPVVSGANTVRVSQSPDKTRVVLDTSNKVDYKLEYDNQEKVVLVTAKNADFTALEAAAKKSNLIRTIVSSKDGENTTIVFELQGATSVSAGKMLPPSGNNSQHRYYFDIF